MTPATRPRRLPRAQRTSVVATLTATALITAACGGGSDDTSPPPSDVVITDATSAEATTTDPPATDSPSTEPPSTEPSTTEPQATDNTPASTPATHVADEESEATDSVESPVRGDTPFDGPAFTDLANLRMEELGATFTLPVTSESLAPIFELPSDFAYPTGTVIGVFHDFELDQRYDDEVRIDEERIVGIDGAGDPATLDAVQLTVEGDTTSRWQRVSSQRDSLNNDLYTALPLDGGEFKDRMVVRGVEEPDPGAPFLQITLEQLPIEIPVPTWKAGLPTVEGGLLTSVREGRGIVDAFGRVPEDGFVEMREYYEIDRFEELEEFFASGIIESAGFTYEDTPFSNFSIRIDVSNEEWAGTVGVGEITIDGELFGYQLIWTLTRPA